MEQKWRFINVEITIRTNLDSNEFFEYFEDQDNCVQKYQEDGSKWYIYSDSIPKKNAGLAIKDLCNMIMNLPVEIKKQWDAAIHRELYVANEVISDPYYFPEHLHVDTLNAEVEVTRDRLTLARSRL